VAVKIRLKRMGKIRQPYYRVVVVDSRKKRDGKVIEQIGKYHPKEEPSFIEVASERALYWLGVGAQPSEAVEAILKVTGDWQKFKGLPGTEGTLRTAEPKRDKTEIFNEALKDAANEPKSEAVTRKKAAQKSAQKAEASQDKPAIEPKADKAAKAEKPTVEDPKAEELKAEETPVEEPKAEETPVEEPKAEESKIEEPAAEAAAEPAADEAPAAEPAADEAPATTDEA
jgi:small subunit ribosomal protein S16